MERRTSFCRNPVSRRTMLATTMAMAASPVLAEECRVGPPPHHKGPPVFMEVNGRFWNSLPLACYAGANFPVWVAQMAETEDVEAMNHFQTGVLCRWLLGDFRHLVEVWRGAPAGYPMPYPGRLSTLLAVMTPLPGTFHDNFQWRDPLPELGDWLSFLERILRREG